MVFAIKEFRTLNNKLLITNYAAFTIKTLFKD